MHEATVAAHLIELAELEAARNAGGGRVVRLVVEMGRLSCLNEEAFRFAFSVLSKGTAAEGAELVVEHVPAYLRCLDCGAETEAEDLFAPCPACGGEAVTVERGAGMVLRSLTVEGDEEGEEDGDTVREEDTRRERQARA